MSHTGTLTANRTPERPPCANGSRLTCYSGAEAPYPPAHARGYFCAQVRGLAVGDHRRRSGTR